MNGELAPRTDCHVTNVKVQISTSTRTNTAASSVVNQTAGAWQTRDNGNRVGVALPHVDVETLLYDPVARPLPLLPAEAVAIAQMTRINRANQADIEVVAAAHRHWLV